MTVSSANGSAGVLSPNYIINGAFDIWQRGTSFTNPVGTSYVADRIRISNTNNPSNHTVSRQNFPAGTSLGGFEPTFFYRSVITDVGISTGVRHQSTQEDVRTLAGQTATASFWAKSDSTRVQPALEFVQSFGVGGSTGVTTSLGGFTTTTEWQRFTFTFNVPSTAGKTIGANNLFRLSISQNLTNGNTLDIWGVQLEAGSVATPFKRNANSIQGELAACQRYFIRYRADESYGYLGGVGYASSTTIAKIMVNFPTEMRTMPTSSPSSISSGGPIMLWDGNSVTQLTGLGMEWKGTKGVQLSATVASGLTAFRPYSLHSNNVVGSFIDFVAEL